MFVVTAQYARLHPWMFAVDVKFILDAKEMFVVVGTMCRDVCCSEQYGFNFLCAKSSSKVGTQLHVLYIYKQLI